MDAKDLLQYSGPATAPLSLAPNPRQRILVVEDDADTRRVNTQGLACSGYEVDAAEDGAAAWAALQLNNYDLIVTDNNMPKVTGVELMAKLQAERMELPVIMATGCSPEEDLNRRGLLPPAVTLLKPHTFDELLTAVKTVLRTASDSFGNIAPPPNWQIQPLAERFPL